MDALRSRSSDHPPGGLQRRTPNRNCLYSVLLLRQGLLHKLSYPSQQNPRKKLSLNSLFYKSLVIHSIQITQSKNIKFPRFSIKNSQDFQLNLLPPHHLIDNPHVALNNLHDLCANSEKLIFPEIAPSHIRENRQDLRLRCQPQSIFWDGKTL